MLLGSSSDSSCAAAVVDEAGDEVPPDELEHPVNRQATVTMLAAMYVHFVAPTTSAYPTEPYGAHRATESQSAPQAV
ncbi:hypothetical protein GCM10027169_36490 [Gordonia jinhuaensis]|uniref:Uncharacterized protein n=1 Tax=Gordonia jinhuaensis TaxID=1517702 RepID=A0A916WTI7_9ACTN|nr:hypothetical protein GCM10011489_16650 [Gordonia jinhuaensis]